jgi:hypothetical protein
MHCQKYPNGVEGTTKIPVPSSESVRQNSAHRNVYGCAENTNKSYHCEMLPVKRKAVDRDVTCVG